MNSTPQRTCFACGRKTDKGRLLRFALRRDGSVVIDRSQRSEGRGLYLCPDQNCIRQAAKRRPSGPVHRRGCGPALAKALAQALEEA